MKGWILLFVAACGGGTTASDARVADTAGDGQSVDDGTPTRMPCTSNFGSALSATPTFGRLDGYLVAVVPPSNMNGCNADSSHVHLQVKMNNAIYDVAIDVTDGQTGIDDVHSTTRDAALPGGMPWTEGWHTGALADYVSMGLHAADLPLATKAELTSTLMTDLATANHISVYATSYGPDGAHLVHRNGGGHDGVIATEPLSSPAHLRMFSFTNQAF